MTVIAGCQDADNVASLELGIVVRAAAANVDRIAPSSTVVAGLTVLQQSTRAH